MTDSPGQRIALEVAKKCLQCGDDPLALEQLAALINSELAPIKNADTYAINHLANATSSLLKRAEKAEALLREANDRLAELARERDAPETKVLMTGQFNTGFMLGVEFGYKQAEKGHNFDKAIEESAKILAAPPACGS